jgi:NADH dehydrogenase
MSGLDRSRRIVKVGPILDTDGDCVVREREVPYDTLVIAVGAVTNDFGTPGVVQNCICLNTPKDAEYLRKKILLQALKVATGNTPVPKVRIGIVGAGTMRIYYVDPYQYPY